MKTQHKIIPLGLLTAVATYFAADVALAQVPVLVTKDKVQSRVGVFRGGSAFTLDAGGHTGKAGDRAVDFRMGTGPVYVQDATFLNALAQNDEMTIAMWAKKYDTADGSAFWANSPSSTGSARGAQAHIPWSNNNIYWDTGGCCNNPNRINADVAGFAGYSGDTSWWTNWHLFVFTKKGVNKEIWIDGQFFLDQQTAHPGENAAPLPTDFTDLYIGSDGSGNGGFHAVVDDFSVFGTALSGTSIGLLFSGTLPTALPASDKLAAYWDFNDFPSEGAFLSVTPQPNATDASPDLIRIIHIDGTTPWDPTNISLKVDGTNVTPSFARDGLKATVSYVPNPIFLGQTTHRASFSYPGAGGPTASFDWEFTVGAYTKDLVHSYIGVFTGGSSFTPGGRGHSGGASDRAANFGNGTGPVDVKDASFLNALAANDEMSFSFWMKKPFIEASSAFWAISPSSSSSQRGFQAHVPWSDSNIYFDTAGCCDAATQRIYQGISTFPGYTGDASWWTNWHHFVFQKKLSTKEVWIDGQMFMTGDNTSPLPTDFTELFIGAASPGVNLISGLIDDFAIFGTALSSDSISNLFSGTLPTALPTTDKLTAYWDFNELPPSGLFVSIIPTPYSTNARPDLVQVVHWDGTTAWDASKVTLKVDDAAVTTTFAKNGAVATVTYIQSPMFAAQSSHKAVLTFPGAGAAQETLAWPFTVGTFPVISQELWTAVSTGDTTKPGLKVRVWQVDQPGSNPLGNRTHRAEQELAGIIGPNVADLTLATDGIFNIDVVNWNQDYLTAGIGFFQPDNPIPGIPGTGSKPDDSIAAEIITYVEFPEAGYYAMGVSSDDGFKVTEADTPPANNLALVVTGAASAAGSYGTLSAPAATAKQFTAPVSGKLVYMDPADGCAVPVNAAALAGNIALVDRGTCEFSTKILNAKNAGAIAVVVVNNRDINNAEGIYPIEMSVGAAGYQNIPAVMISMPDGDKIKTGLTGELNASLTPDSTPALGEFDGGRGIAETVFGFIVPTAGVYPLRCVWYEGNGGANVEWYSITTAGDRVLINDRTQAAALKGFRARTAAPVQRPTMNIARDGATWKITYTGTLQSAASANGTYADVPGATSPYPVTATGTQMFFRARK